MPMVNVWMKRRHGDTGGGDKAVMYKVWARNWRNDAIGTIFGHVILFLEYVYRSECLLSTHANSFLAICSFLEKSVYVSCSTM